MIDIKSLGAVGTGYDGDSSHAAEDTQAFAKALVDAGPNNRIYFPPGTYWIDGTQINFPNVKNTGWLSIELDGTINLLNGPLRPKLNTVIQGRCGDPQGLAGSFVYGRYASIQVKKGYGNFPCIELAGSQAVVLRGLNLQVDGASPALHMHDDNGGAGCVWNTIEDCVLASTDPGSPAILWDVSAPTITAGFGLFIRRTAMGSQGDYAIRAYNCGMVSIRESFFAGAGMYIENRGAPSMTAFTLDEILTEGFRPEMAMLTTRGIWLGNVVMRQIHIADPMGKSYLLDAEPAPGSPAKYGVLGVRIEGYDGDSNTAILSKQEWPNAPGGAGLGACNVHGFDSVGNTFLLNPYSEYAI